MAKVIKAPYFKIETFGAVDGPGIRMVLFLQGCPYRCLYCHNPESWDLNGSDKYITPAQVIQKYKDNESFYKNDGGITISGGEPLIHYDFCLEVCKLATKENINVALDTSGATFTKANINKYKKFFDYNTMWLVDIKHINKTKHKTICGINNTNELDLIKFLDANKQRYWVRQVFVPKYTDDKKDLEMLGKFLKSLKHMEKFELLPYHTLGISKYTNLKIPYRLKGIKEPTNKQIKEAMNIIKNS